MTTIESPLKRRFRRLTRSMNRMTKKLNALIREAQQLGKAKHAVPRSVRRAAARLSLKLDKRSTHARRMRAAIKQEQS